MKKGNNTTDHLIQPCTFFRGQVNPASKLLVQANSFCSPLPTLGNQEIHQVAFWVDAIVC